MSVLAIELNDAGILAASETLVADVSPGYAVLKPDDVLIGKDAFAKSRIHPRKTNLSYWHNLNTNELDNPVGAIKTHADIAFGHLQQIYEPYKKSADKVIIGVPASFSGAQLGLILGMCQKAGIPVSGLVDTALAAVNHPTPGDRILVVDATNHCVLITELHVANGLRRGEVVRLDNIGLKDFTSRWAACIGDAFVHATRFDPLHSAESEQWLYDAIPDLAQQISSGAEQIDIRSRDEKYETSVERAVFIAAVAGLYQPIVNAVAAKTESGKVTTVVCTSRIASLPGLMDLIDHEPGFRVTQVPVHAVVKTLLSEVQNFESREDGFSLVMQRPWQATPSLVVSAADQQKNAKISDANQATHVLIDALAFPISEEPFTLGTSLAAHQWGHQITGIVKGISRQHCSIARKGTHIVVSDNSTYGTWVNGKKIEGQQQLQIGDLVQIGNPGIEAMLIRQVVSDG